MKMPNMIILRIGFAGLALMINTAMAQGSHPQQYCSSQNTGSDDTPEYSIYMSMGKCFDYCKAGYAFAVVQGKNCWCSDYIPANQQSTSDCDAKCPGFPSDLCGNVQQGLYGYIPLSKEPSGTAGAGSSAPSTSSSVPQSSDPPPTSYVSVTTTQTVTTKQTKARKVVTSYVTPSSSSSSSNPVSSVPISSSSWSSSSMMAATTPHTTVRVITKSGSVVTQTVTQTPIVIGSGSANSSPENMSVSRRPLSMGAIAGVVVGSLIGLSLILVAAFLLWRRKKNVDSEDGNAAGATRRPKRNISVLSKTGLLSRNRPQSMVENNYEDHSGADGQSVRHSMMFGAGATVEGVNPASPLGSSQENIESRRQSRPMVYDQRLNPSALFANADANGSRVSMQDQNDYSRPLGVANPDFRASFDSRLS